MDKQQISEASAAIAMMLTAFPSSQSSISADGARVYLFAVEEFSLEAVKRACRAFVKGEVKDHNPDFAPSAPKLAQVVKEIDRNIQVEQWEAQRVFVEASSDLWRKVSALKQDACLPTFSRNGKEGWFFAPQDVQEAQKLALPPPLTPEQEAAMLKRISRLRFTVGDPDAENGDMGQSKRDVA